MADDSTGFVVVLVLCLFRLRKHGIVRFIKLEFALEVRFRLGFSEQVFLCWVLTWIHFSLGGVWVEEREIICFKLF